ncbi:MAG: chorismate synthase [Ignavibacteriaceae bacterium]|nr:chorismate synthase [Ignavibacteriaceae bacterium]
MRFLTAGESHGKSLSTIIEGFPSNLDLTSDYINFHLKRRQAGYGRGQRMKIETDTSEILSGVRFGKTLGSPISLIIKNSDWENWTKIMSPDIPSIDFNYERVSIPRPGHADLVGISKYNFDDIRNSIERSSARETAARVAAGSIARKFLENFGITVGSFVESIGGIYPAENYLFDLLQNKVKKNYSAWQLSVKADRSQVRVLDAEQENKIIRKIKTAKKKGDSLGGTFVTVATGVPVGLGSYMHYERRLSSNISHSIMSIQAVKGVEIGLGFAAANGFGSEVHDEIVLKGNSFTRTTNNAGGIDGGISNGLPIIVRAAMKPISTLMKPLKSVDLKTMKKVEARRERSDFVAVPACAVISESMLAWTLAQSFLEKFGGDSMEETMDNYQAFTGKLQNRIKNNFRRS